MTKKSSETRVYAPYIPFTTFKSFVDKLKNSTTPPVIDNSVLHSMSGSMKSQLMSALRFLKLVDGNGTVHENLKRLVISYKTDTWQDTLSGIILDAYQPVTSNIDLDSGTASQLNDSFRKNGNVDGQMLEKAVRFFLSSLKESGTTFSPHFATRKIRKPVSKKRKKPKSLKGEDEDSDERDDEKIDSELAKFRIPIPSKKDVIIYLPKEISEEDWNMVKVMLDAYVNRLTK